MATFIVKSIITWTSTEWRGYNPRQRGRGCCFLKGQHIFGLYYNWSGESYIVTRMWPDGGLFENLDDVVQAFLEAAIASVDAPTFEGFLIAVEYEMVFQGFVFQRANPNRVLPVENIKFYGGGDTPVALEVNGVRHTTTVTKYDNMEDCLRWVWDTLALETPGFVEDLISEIREEVGRAVCFTIEITIAL